MFESGALWASLPSSAPFSCSCHGLRRTDLSEAGGRFQKSDRTDDTRAVRERRRARADGGSLT
jgi:hypothetical protein